MSDEPRNELDELIGAAARDYNRPGATPREEIWQRIRAQRDAARQERHAAPLRRHRWAIGVAAAAVLVLGVALGRGYERVFGDRTSTFATNPAATTNAGDTGTAQVVGASPLDSGSTPVAAPSAPDGREPRVADGPRAPVRQPALADRGAAPEGSTGRANLTYHVAVLEHLAGTEAMLTSFRSAAKRGEVDAELTRWARSLLTTTRLLQATAGSQDPTMKRLLGDLELVLMQIAQYTTAGTRSAEELELIEHSIERRGVIGKIRTTIPARLTPAGT